MIARIIAIGLALLVVAAGDHSASAASRAVGNFSSVAVSGPDCISPVGICTAGELTGGLKGTFSFTGTNLIPTTDTPTTGVLLYTGDLVLTTKDGQLFCKDAGAFQTTGAGAVSSVCVIVSGTGGFTGATGTIQFVGTFTFASGGEGEYRASYNVP